jgi:methionyl-tRNA formyltransferase
VRTVFLGTSEFAATVLEHLAVEKGEGAPHRPTLVLTRPDRPAGRGRKLTAPPVADAARRLQLELAQPDSVNDPSSRELIGRARPDVLVVCAFGALVKEPLLSDYEMLNVHPSLLPRWRGAAPIERAIMAGDERTGVSIMRLTAGLDSGPVCLSASESIGPRDTYGSLAPRLARAGGELLVSALDALGRGEGLPFAEQEERLVTYAEKIGAEDRLLDPSRAAAELECVVRALQPHIGARVALPDGTLLGVHRAALSKDAPGSPGVHASDRRLLLGCAHGALELLLVQPPGGQAMDAAAYLRGHGDPRGRADPRGRDDPGGRVDPRGDGDRRGHAG